LPGAASGRQGGSIADAMQHPTGHSAPKTSKQQPLTALFRLVGRPDGHHVGTCVRISGMEKRKHWWNGRWGRLSRRDILLYEDAGQWWIEARHGGSDGRTRWLECAGEDAALNAVRDLMIGTDGWRELPTI
jgi:hypothetical protein